MRELSERVKEQARAMLADGRKIEAIKLVREETGCGLLEAKVYVETLGRGPPPASSGDFEQELVALLRENKTIEAVKYFRQETGAGLKEAYDAVRELGQRHGISVRAGCFGLLLAAVTLGAFLLT